MAIIVQFSHINFRPWQFASLYTTNQYLFPFLKTQSHATSSFNPSSQEIFYTWSPDAINFMKGQKTNESLVSALKIIGRLTNKHNHVHFPYLFGILKSLKVNEGKATGATRALVIHHIDPSQRTIARKHLPQVTLCSVQAQSKHPQTRARVRVCLEGSKIWVRVRCSL